jgi:putative nucleotidyltransferase with HDIG domain
MSRPKKEKSNGKSFNLKPAAENPYHEIGQDIPGFQAHLTKVQLIQKLSAAMELYDLNTCNHQERTAVLARAIALRMGLAEERVNDVYWAALVHDIGKFRIPKEILCKPGKLNNYEYGIIQKHSKYGFEILQQIDLLKPVAPIILQHHERINGSGYPRGIRGDQILMEAKILGVADVVDAMTSLRPYRSALKDETTINELYRNRNILYHPDVVDSCITLLINKILIAAKPASSRS